MAKRSKQQHKLPSREGEPQKPAAAGRGPSPWTAAVLLAISVGAIYASALHAPFIFDDRHGIAENESIQKLWPLVGSHGQPGPLNPGPDLPTSPRPLVNLSLAANYAFGGINPFGYHLYSVVVHFLAAWLLWALVRRTLLLPYFDRRFERSAGWLALAAGLLWALHPLATESVIYATQRSELMMAFFYLATLYCSLRYWMAGPRAEPSDSRARFVWLTLATVSCLAGMASKEVMVSAPLMVLLYERTFITGSLSKSLRQSWPLYICLAATWLLLLFVSLRAPYGAAAGFQTGVPVYEWWLTQTKVVLLYLKLAVWPWPLLIHYDLPYLKTPGEAWMYLLPVAVLGIVTLVLLWRKHPAGYLGTAVFAILAPTSVIPIRLEMAAERRMYLPLAAIAVLIVVGCYSLFHRARPRSEPGRQMAPSPSSLWMVAAAVVVLVALAFAGVSTKRLVAYDNEMTLWHEVLQHQPDSFLAHNNLGIIYTNAGRPREAISELQAALAVKPDYLFALNNLGNALMADNRLPEAAGALQSAIRVDPDYFQARNNLGIVLMRMGRPADAVEPLQQALRLMPGNKEVRINLGTAYTNIGRIDDSIREYESVLAEDPDNVMALINLSIALARTGHVPQAIERVQHAIRLQPNDPNAHTNLGVYLSSIGQVPQAMEQFKRALELNPNDSNTHVLYGNLLTAAGRATEAIPHLQQALRLQPNLVDAYSGLGLALQKAGRPQEAVEPYQTALRLAPSVPAYTSLAGAYRFANRPQEAIATARQSLDLATSQKQPETIAEIRQWLNQYQAELQQKGN